MKPTLRGRMTAILAAAGIALAAGIAYASIPDAGGVIHACYRVSTDDQKGQLRAVEDPASCRANEAPLAWNVAGPPGPPGPSGPPGEDGEDGEDGTFSGTFTSPNGQYSLSVTDAGIVLASPDSSIRLSSGAIEVESTGTDAIRVRGAAGVELTSGLGLDLDVGAGLTVAVGGSTFIESGGGATFRATNVGIGPAFACEPAARYGDDVDPVTHRIRSGSTNVCIG